MTITKTLEAPSAPRDTATLNKLMFVKLMPLLIAAYVLSFLDRTNIVGPSVMGLIEQSTGNAMNGMKVIAVVLVIAAIAASRLRQGQERKTAQKQAMGAAARESV
jgi:hypothetical protein